MVELERAVRSRRHRSSRARPGGTAAPRLLPRRARRRVGAASTTRCRPTRTDQRRLLAGCARMGGTRRFDQVLAEGVRITWRDLQLDPDHEFAQWATNLPPDPSSSMRSTAIRANRSMVGAPRALARCRHSVGWIGAGSLQAWRFHPEPVDGFAAALRCNICGQERRCFDADRDLGNPGESDRRRSALTSPARGDQSPSTRSPQAGPVRVDTGRVRSPEDAGVYARVTGNDDQPSTPPAEAERKNTTVKMVAPLAMDVVKVCGPPTGVPQVPT